jgi:succinoglycan biosynthesis protein ExoV
MKMFYFDRAPNYGDALNPWMWPRLLGDRLQPNSPTLFLGIGTILKNDLPKAERYAVLGSGGGYGPFPTTDHRWNFYAVRGPLTAQALGLDPDLAAIDGAYLMRKFDLPKPVENGPRIGFMPHWGTQLRIPWEKICAMSGLRYINPKLSVEETLGQLQGCDGIIAEAMHAAITADALRIRWVPVRLGEQFLDFKWRDWLGSLELTANPILLPSIQPRLKETADEGLIHRSYRRTVNSTTYAVKTLGLVARLRAIRRKFETNASYGHLSDERIMNHRLDRLERGLDRLRNSEN